MESYHTILEKLLLGIREVMSELFTQLDSYESKKLNKNNLMPTNQKIIIK